jgi:hypothetical protein
LLGDLLGDLQPIENCREALGKLLENGREEIEIWRHFRGMSQHPQRP